MLLKELLTMRRLLQSKLAVTDIVLLLGMALAASLLQGPAAVSVASGPTLPPQPWENIQLASGPTLPPQPWENIQLASGPTLPPQPWENIQLAA